MIDSKKKLEHGSEIAGQRADVVIDLFLFDCFVFVLANQLENSDTK